MRNHRLSKSEYYELIIDELRKITNNLYEINKNSNKLINELTILNKNTEGLNYILLENQKKDGNQENSRG